MKFTSFNLAPQLLEGLEASRFTDATPIQEKCIPAIIEGKDLLGTAQTGTGKTGAFVIPILHNLCQKKADSKEAVTRVLILTPTRELASQIDEQIFALGYHTGVHSAIVIGGSDFGAQAKSMQHGVDIVVATPGRLLDQMNVLQLNFAHLEYLVLDEADRMLDMGFLPDVKSIIGKLPKKRQNLMFSATFPPQIQKLTAEIMDNPVRVNVATTKAADTIRQEVYQVYEADKINLLRHLFANDLKGMPAIVFTATKRGADQLSRTLNKSSIPCVAMHGDRSQEEREFSLREFSTGKANILVATDVIARGIDIQDVGVIINFDCPKTVEDYIHRIGRTGRNEKKGRAITLVSPRDARLFKPIRDKVGKQLNEMQVPDAVLNNMKEKRSNNRKDDRQAQSQSTQNMTDNRANRVSANNPQQPKKEETKRSYKTEEPRKNTETPKKVTVSPKKNAKMLHVMRVPSATERLKPGSKPTKGYIGIIKAMLGI